MIRVFTSIYYQANTVCYDLGCSLGASALMISQATKNDNKRIIAVDYSPAMINACHQKTLNNLLPKNIDFICSDIRDIKIKNASIVVLNFTLQFIDIRYRDMVIKNIYNGMVPNGILILSEKIIFSNSKENNFQMSVHHQFKKINDYSKLEIEQKKLAIKDTLIPETFKQHHNRLQKNGFQRIYKWFQCANFISIIAFK
jgi:tRNA (cmo5U34)-methyltransferase